MVLFTIAGRVDAQRGIRVPPRPESKIIDAMEILPESQEQTLSAELIQAKEDHGISMFVVTLSGTPSIRLSDLTKYYFGGWQDAPITAFVATYPEYPDKFYLLAGGDGLPPESRKYLLKAVRGAMDKAEAEPEVAYQLVTASREFLRSLIEIKGEIEKVRLDPTYGQRELRVPFFEKFWFLKPLYLALGLAVIGAIVGLWFLAKWLRNRRPLELPDIEPRARFGAPCSGGSNIRISFRRRRTE